MESKHCFSESGAVQFSEMSKLLKKSFERLKVDPKESPTFFTERVLTPRATREKLFQMMMEDFKVPAFGICVDAIMALYSAELISGTVWDCSDLELRCIPIYEGYVQSPAIGIVPEDGDFDLDLVRTQILLNMVLFLKYATVYIKVEGKSHGKCMHEKCDCCWRSFREEATRSNCGN